MNQRLEVYLARDFSPTPGARSPEEGNFSGQEFREEHLLPAINLAQQNGQKVCIILDEPTGYGTAFLEEVFGGLIRINKKTMTELEALLEFVSDDEPYLIQDIMSYMKEAEHQENMKWSRSSVLEAIHAGTSQSRLLRLQKLGILDENNQLTTKATNWGTRVPHTATAEDDDDDQ